MALEWIGDTLLPRLLAAGLQSLLVVAAVWLLCRYLRLSAALRCWLWWFAALQMLIGALWPTPLSLPLLPASLGHGASVGSVAPQLSAAAQLPFFVTRGDLGATAPATASAASSMASDWLSWPLVFAALWLSGFALIALLSLRAYAAARRRVAESRPCEQPQVLHTYRSLGDSLGLNRLPPLCLSAEIDSPQLIGPWPDAVLLPGRRMAQFSADELAMALHHELVHVRRRDLWWGWVPALVQHLFFFHPLAHVIAREYSIAREAACDAAVLESRRYAAHDYGRLLLRLGVAPRPSAGVASASPTYTVLKRRLIMLQNATSSSPLGGLVLTAAVVLIALVPYRVTAAAGERQSQSVSIHSADKGAETRITELKNHDDPLVWAVKGGEYYRVGADGRYQVVTDPVDRARLQQRMREAKQAGVDAERAGREAEQAGREAAQAGRDAERAGREAALHAQQASIEARRVARDAGRQAALEGRRAGDQARLDAEQARRDVEQAQRDVQQAQRDAEQARRDADQARRDAEQHARDSEQARRDGRRHVTDSAPARRVVEYTRPEPRRPAQPLSAAEIRRISEQATRDANQYVPSAAEIRSISEQAIRDASKYAPSAAEIRRISEQASRDASKYALSDAEIRRISEQAIRDANKYAPSADEIRRISEQASRDASQYALSAAEIGRITEQARRDALQ